MSIWIPFIWFTIILWLGAIVAVGILILIVVLLLSLIIDRLYESACEVHTLYNIKKYKEFWYKCHKKSPLEIDSSLSEKSRLPETPQNYIKPPTPKPPLV